MRLRARLVAEASFQVEPPNDRFMPEGDVTGDGAVAQLGERLVRNEEVRGSIPLSSTIISGLGPSALPC